MPTMTKKTLFLIAGAVLLVTVFYFSVPNHPSSVITSDYITIKTPVQGKIYYEQTINLDVVFFQPERGLKRVDITYRHENLDSWSSLVAFSYPEPVLGSLERKSLLKHEWGFGMYYLMATLVDGSGASEKAMVSWEFRPTGYTETTTVPLATTTSGTSVVRVFQYAAGFEILGLAILLVPVLFRLQKRDDDFDE